MIDSNDCLGSPPSEDAARPKGLPRKRGGTGDYKGAALNDMKTLLLPLSQYQKVLTKGIGKPV